MIGAWTTHLKSEEDIKKFKRSLHSALTALDRLDQILSEIDGGLVNQELSLKLYDTPNWDNKQAHINGQRSVIRTIKTLINLDPKELK